MPGYEKTISTSKAPLTTNPIAIANPVKFGNIAFLAA
jgi:hypothetical protein